MNDPCDAICDAIVAFLKDQQAATPNPYGVTFVPSNPDDPDGAIVQENTDLQVLLVPYGDTEEKQGRGGQVLETFEVTMVTTRLVDNTFTKKRLLKLVRDIRESLRGQKMAGLTYLTSSTATKLDTERMHLAARFLNVTRFSYVGTC